jgi:hypothetical protein
MLQQQYHHKQQLQHPTTQYFKTQKLFQDSFFEQCFVTLTTLSLPPLAALTISKKQ